MDCSDVYLDNGSFSNLKIRIIFVKNDICLVLT